MQGINNINYSLLTITCLFNPFAHAFRQPAVGDRAVAGGFRVAPEGNAHDALPPAGHAGPRVAAEAPAVGPRGENVPADAVQVCFVNPFRGDGHDVVAVVQHPRKTVGMAEVVEGFHEVSAEARGGIQRPDGLVRAVHPDELDLVLGSQVGNPAGIGLAVLPSPCRIARTVNDPGDSGGGVLLLDLGDADGGGPYKVGPPVVMPVRLYSQSFPLSEGGTAAHDDVDGPGQSRTAHQQGQNKKKA